MHPLVLLHALHYLSMKGDERETFGRIASRPADQPRVAE